MNVCLRCLYSCSHVTFQDCIIINVYSFCLTWGKMHFCSFSSIMTGSLRDERMEIWSESQEMPTKTNPTTTSHSHPIPPLYGVDAVFRMLSHTFLFSVYGNDFRKMTTCLRGRCTTQHSDSLRRVTFRTQPVYLVPRSLYARHDSDESR